MTGTLLVVVRSGADNQQIVAEALDAAIVCSAFGMEVSLLFEGDGLEYLEETRLRELLKHATADDFARVMAYEQSSTSASIERLSSSQILELFQANQAVMVT